MTSERDNEPSIIAMAASSVNPAGNTASLQSRFCSAGDNRS